MNSRGIKSVQRYCPKCEKISKFTDVKFIMCERCHFKIMKESKKNLFKREGVE